MIFFQKPSSFLPLRNSIYIRICILKRWEKVHANRNQKKRRSYTCVKQNKLKLRTAKRKLGMMVHAGNPSTWEVEMGES
jgi:hypothetical protein